MESLQTGKEEQMAQGPQGGLFQGNPGFVLFCLREGRTHNFLMKIEDH